MRLGFVLPQVGLLGTAANLVKVAEHAEALGCSIR
jgi:hypothetical protein